MAPSQSPKSPPFGKKSIVIPLLKPGKPPQDWSSYRPVSLLCPAVKILEGCILPILQYHLTPEPHQHGFRPLHSTTTALLEISSAVADGFNQKKPADRTVLVTLDLSKAFDMICHRTLLEKLSRTSLPPSLTRWLSGYLTGRQARTLFRGETSPARIVRTGVPQGSVISLTLFNSYVGSLPSPPEGVNLVSYADDVTPWASGPKISIITAKLQSYLDSLTSYFQSLKLGLSPGKCAVTLLTPDTKESNVQPHLTVADIPLKLEKHPKVLGVRFDPMFKFGDLAGSLPPTPPGRSTPWRHLQARTGVRTRKRNSWPLKPWSGHEEMQVLPVKAHTAMLATQHLLACHLPEHPGQRLREKPPPPRKMKPALVSAHAPRLEHLLEGVDLPLPTKEYRRLLKTVHTETVATTTQSYPPSGVLGTRPPPVNVREEKTLPRRTRRTLSQLRSGYSQHLLSYRARLEPDQKSSCPLCHTARHTTAHLFQGPTNPTNLPLTALWTNPVEAARFIDLAGVHPIM